MRLNKASLDAPHSHLSYRLITGSTRGDKICFDGASNNIFGHEKAGGMVPLSLDATQISVASCTSSLHAGSGQVWQDLNPQGFTIPRLSTVTFSTRCQLNQVRAEMTQVSVDRGKSGIVSKTAVKRRRVLALL